MVGSAFILREQLDDFAQVYRVVRLQDTFRQLFDPDKSIREGPLNSQLRLRKSGISVGTASEPFH